MHGLTREKGQANKGPSLKETLEKFARQQSPFEQKFLIYN